jgi:ribonuclease HI
MPDLFAYTDGACSGNPGPGGWGALMIARDGNTVVKQRELKGGEAHTTNNRMELLAAIHALEALEKPSTITIITDSAYVKGGITEWIHNWKRRGWKTSTNKPVKNDELWKRLRPRWPRRE